MTPDELKNEVSSIGLSATKQNAIAKVLELHSLTKHIMEQFNSAVFKSSYEGFLDSTKERIKYIETKNKEFETEIAKNELLIDQKEDIERQYLILEPKIKQIEELKEKQNALCLDYNSLVANYNELVEKIKEIKIDLESINEKHSGVIAVYKDHHLENETIYGALRDRVGVLHYVELLRKDISERLNQYDTQIKTLVEKREQLPIYELEETKQYQ